MEIREQIKVIKELWSRVYCQFTEADKATFGKAVKSTLTILEKLEKVDFEKFLRDKHAEEYVGTDDMMVDDFNDWVQDLWVDDTIRYGNEFVKSIIK